MKYQIIEQPSLRDHFSPSILKGPNGATILSGRVSKLDCTRKLRELIRQGDTVDFIYPKKTVTQTYDQFMVEMKREDDFNAGRGEFADIA